MLLQHCSLGLIAEYPNKFAALDLFRNLDLLDSRQTDSQRTFAQRSFWLLFAKILRDAPGCTTCSAPLDWAWFVGVAVLVVDVAWLGKTQAQGPRNHFCAQASSYYYAAELGQWKTLNMANLVKVSASVFLFKLLLGLSLLFGEFSISWQSIMSWSSNSKSNHAN